MVNYEYERPIASVDVALFTLAEGAAHPGRRRPGKWLHVALAERREAPAAGAFAIPGGYVRPAEDADLDATAARVLRQKCGVEDVFLEQLRTYGGRDRDPRDWSITVGYFALVPPHVLERSSIALKLVPVDGLDGLPFDHDAIVADGVERIRGRATYSTLPTKLLPEKFTLGDLEEVYEAVLGRDIDSAGFRKKVADLTFDRGGEAVRFLQDTEERRVGRNRPAAIYRKATEDLVVFKQRF